MNLLNTRIILFTFLILSLSTPLFSQTANKQRTEKQTPKVSSKSWKLVFSDEFNKTGDFDTSKWSYCKRWQPAWAKFLTASSDYVSQDGKNLVLRMDNKVISGDDIPYHSGGIQTSGKFSITYGKVEVRAKFNKGKGSWPAIWMMPESNTYGGWPKSGEIDIMEHVNTESVIHHTIHNAQVTGADGGSTATKSVPYNENDFNTYSIIWNQNEIQFYTNGTLQYTYTKPTNTTSKEWPFDKPFYLILNQSGGAGWPGKIIDTDLPFKMEVDWVRVYK
ncbi:glycoside hydrolase family 16 protein [Pedobacter frigoris]|uniref:Glycoside hydrolase family 16 protein n=1 Tax=Pedobacter frigoris TaxID=2571272 RepID=A0A4U1CU62_9SPHI|nr:glycoside hydrolase family 16 protein [Pedobacter frigoris]TKC09539.1 glycoside hydrolase family 16 protein [Pedobacter frigoris]